MPRAVFLDRDGVLNDPVLDPVDGRPESPLRAGDVALVGGAADGCRILQASGYELVVVSNQPGAAKGKASLEALWAVHERVVELLAASGVEIADWRYCFHHPDAELPRLRARCTCRKPAPGMLRDAAAARGLALAGSWMIGDADTDVAAGERAGCRTVLLAHPASAHRRTGASRPTLRAPDLRTAATILAAEPLSLPAVNPSSHLGS